MSRWLLLLAPVAASARAQELLRLDLDATPWRYVVARFGHRRFILPRGVPGTGEVGIEVHLAQRGKNLQRQQQACRLRESRLILTLGAVGYDHRVYINGRQAGALAPAGIEKSLPLKAARVVSLITRISTRSASDIAEAARQRGQNDDITVVTVHGSWPARREV